MAWFVSYPSCPGIEIDTERALVADFMDAKPTTDRISQKPTTISLWDRVQRVKAVIAVSPLDVIGLALSSVVCLVLTVVVPPSLNDVARGSGIYVGACFLVRGHTVRSNVGRCPPHMWGLMWGFGATRSRSEAPCMGWGWHWASGEAVTER